MGIYFRVSDFIESQLVEIKLLEMVDGDTTVRRVLTPN